MNFKLLLNRTWRSTEPVSVEMENIERQ